MWKVKAEHHKRRGPETAVFSDTSELAQMENWSHLHSRSDRPKHTKTRSTHCLRPPALSLLGDAGWSGTFSSPLQASCLTRQTISSKPLAPGHPNEDHISAAV